MEEKLLSHPFQPMTWDLILKEVFYHNPGEGNDVLSYLKEQGSVVYTGGNLYFHRKAVERARDMLRKYLSEHGRITAAEARDLLGSSRKFIIPLLEYFDSMGFTHRSGNERMLRQESGNNYRGGTPCGE